jgi:hypothetical protein
MQNKREDNSLNIGVFSEGEILSANQKHDVCYGWSREWASLYTNPFRLPESVLGEPFENLAGIAEYDYSGHYAHPQP